MVTVRFVKLNSEIKAPKMMTQGSSGFDIEASDDAILWPNKPEIIPTGIGVEIPLGYELQIRPRSSLAGRGILLANSPGTIDSDYRGMVGIILVWTGQGPYNIKKGDRIAQLVLQSVPVMELVEVDKLTATKRGIGGYGSTGR